MKELKIGCPRPAGAKIGEGSGEETWKPGPDLVGKVWEVWKVDQAF